MILNQEIMNCLVEYCNKNVLAEIERLRIKADRHLNPIDVSIKLRDGSSEKQILIEHVNELKKNVDDFCWRVIELINVLYPEKSVSTKSEDSKDTHK